jgi:hypothetical protein
VIIEKVISSAKNLGPDCPTNDFALETILRLNIEAMPKQLANFL